MILRCIFLGVRHRGELLINTFTTDRRFDAVALVDESVSVCRQAIVDNDWMDLPCYDDFSQALCDIPADAVVIMEGAANRAEAAREALKMGLHVYVANPLAPSLVEAIRVVQYAAACELSLVVDAPHRYGVTERTLAGWTREARHGALTGAIFTVAIPASETPTVWDRCAPDLCALLPIIGWGIDRVGEAHSNDAGVHATLMFRDGRCCRYEARSDRNLVELRLDFERASLRAVGSDTRNKCLELALPPAGFHSVGICDADDPDPRERFPKESFYRAVTQGGRVADDGHEHLQALAVVEAMQQAVDTGGTARVLRL